MQEGFSCFLKRVFRVVWGRGCWFLLPGTCFAPAVGMLRYPPQLPKTITEAETKQRRSGPLPKQRQHFGLRRLPAIIGCRISPEIFGAGYFDTNICRALRVIAQSTAFKKLNTNYFFAAVKVGNGCPAS